MKSEKGITLISITVYVIAIVIIVSIVAVITTYFYKNVDDTIVNIDPATQYAKFNTFFAEEVNKSNIKILECQENYIAFDNGVQYTFVEANKGVYHNKVKICKDVTNCIFSAQMQNGNQTVTVTMIIGGKTYENTYTLKK